jgi:hypothetical protein
MALHELQLEQNAVDVALGQSSTRFVVLDRIGLTVYDYSITPKSVKEPTLIERYQLPEECGDAVQVSMRGDDEVYVLTHVTDTNRDEIHSRRIGGGGWNRLSLEMDHIASIFSDQSYDKLYVQNSQGLISKVSSSAGQDYPIKLSALCPWTELVELADEVGTVLLVRKRNN